MIRYIYIYIVYNKVYIYIAYDEGYINSRETIGLQTMLEKEHRNNKAL